MSDHLHRSADAASHSTPARGAAADAATPGKRTLVESVQRSAAADAKAGTSVQAAATEGISGSSGPLPHVDKMQGLFGGHDLGNIEAHTDASAATGARAMGAQAFATGNHVAFASTPDLHTAAHEAAHVVQQRAGVHLKGGVGEVGDPYERNADEVADRIVQGKSAHDLLPPVQSGAGPTGATQRAVQRKGNPKEITEAQIKAALAWVTSSKIGTETVKEIQGVCKIDKSGTYDEATVKAVFAKQQELGIGADGMAGPTFCQRTQLIFTHQITAATVADKDLETIKTKFPHGVTVAIYPAYTSSVSGASEFKLQADLFAKNQQAVGVSSGAAVLGKACPINEVGEVIEVVQSIHRGLVDKWTASQPAASPDAKPAAPADPPEYTKVLNLALFSHGESWGMGMNATNDFSGGGLHSTKRGMNPANIEAFVRGLSDAVVKGVRVELFACSTGRDTSRTEYEEWTNHKQGDKGGGDSFAASMAKALGPDATVSAHTTVGHTTENYAARVFGAEGGGEQGTTLFDGMYPESFVQSELARLFPDLGSDERGARHDSLREQMWAHFKDSFIGSSAKRYTVPMGQESFVNPENARKLLHDDWTANWIPSRLKDVKPPPEKKK